MSMIVFTVGLKWPIFYVSDENGKIFFIQNANCRNVEINYFSKTLTNVNVN